MGVVTWGNVDDWQIYPLNLSISAIQVDAHQCHVRLSDDAERLFVSQEQPSQVRILNVNGANGESNILDDVTIEAPDQLLSYLRKPASTRVVRILQSYSWGPLLVGEETFRKLFTTLQVHPNFLDVVHLFGRKVTAVHESTTAIFTRMYPKTFETGSCGYEIGYSIKYVARHGRNLPLDPFSIRETGIYHKFCPQTSASTWILLNPCDALDKRLCRAFEESNIANPAGQFLCHALILTCLAGDWRDYVLYLEDHFSKLMDRSFFSSVTQPVREGKIEVDYKDVRGLQILQDKLKRLAHLLQLNLKTSTQMRTLFQRAKLESPPELTALYDHYEAVMEDYLCQTDIQHSQLVSLLNRAEGVGSLVQHILDMRANETSHRLNLAMHDLSLQSATENKLVRRLTTQATQDTRSMKAIALISSIFLPATFIAVILVKISLPNIQKTNAIKTLFGSNFFGFVDDSGTRMLTIASNFWIYVVVVSLTSTIMAACWYFWWFRRRMRPVKVDDLESTE